MIPESIQKQIENQAERECPNNYEGAAYFSGGVFGYSLSLTEIEGLKKENERVSGLVKMLFMAYRDTDTAEANWQSFAKANNIKL
jgi:hypothetical protein